MLLPLRQKRRWRGENIPIFRYFSYYTTKLSQLHGMKKTRFMLFPDLYMPNCVPRDWESFRCHELVFHGNFPWSCSLTLCFSPKGAPTVSWHWILPAFSFPSATSSAGKYSASLLVETIVSPHQNSLDRHVFRVCIKKSQRLMAV